MSNQHPDFDALSAHLDGEAPEWDAHVAGCAACGSMASRIRTTSALVATAVPPISAAARDQALSRALVGFTGTTTPGESSGETHETHRDTLESLGIDKLPEEKPLRWLRSVPTTGTGDPPVESGTRRRRERSGRWIGLGSAAAVLMAFVVGVGVLVGGDGDGGDTATVASGAPPSQERTATAPADSSATSEAQGSAPMNADAGGSAAGGVDGGDLGEIPDSPALAARAGPVLAQRDVDAAREAPAAALSGGQGVSGPAPAFGAEPTPKVAGTRPCEMEARTARPDLGTVVYYATGRVKGVPVVVLGFAPGPAPAPVTLLALAQAEACRIVLEAAGP